MTTTPETGLNQSTPRGGEFVVRDISADQTWIPELKTEDQRMIMDMLKDFIDTEITPVQEDIDYQRNDVTPKLMQKMGELGLLGAHIPEEYGGMQMDTNTNTLIADVLGPIPSFTVSFAAHTGIGMLPILYFGTEEQKTKYLPQLCAGTLKAAYCLTEPGSGSDALGAKTKAILSEDGVHYHITGQKMWITNAGFADIFIVFAQIDGDKFTGFIVEKGTEGLSLGAEEDKLGIKGSSTRQVFFENVKVPASNVLGEIGKGHLIAFNALNMGRFKLGALCMGGCKGLTEESIKYALEREQFGKPIASFGAIQYKLAEQVIRNWVMESAQYRVSNDIQVKIKSLVGEGLSHGEAKLQAAEEYAIECAILKVAGSEILDYVVDEAVQIHGGMGFSEETVVARAYRDARINRIFEGTNEINRLLMVDQLMKRAFKGNFDIVGPAWEVQKELASMPKMLSIEGPYPEEQKALKNMKKIFLMSVGGAAKKQMDGEINLKHEQQILMNAADMMIDIYLAESALLRLTRLEDMETPIAHEVYESIVQCYIYDAMDRVAKYAKDAIVSYAGGDVQKIFLMGIQRFNQYRPINVRDARRKVAQTLIDAGHNIFA